MNLSLGTSFESGKKWLENKLNEHNEAVKRQQEEQAARARLPPRLAVPKR